MLAPTFVYSYCRINLTPRIMISASVMSRIKQLLVTPTSGAIALSLTTAATIGLATPTIAHNHAQSPNHPMGEMQASTADALKSTGEMQPSKMMSPKMDKSQMGAHQKAGHHHQKVAISAGQTVPKVSLQVTPDAVSGWNLQIQLEDFRFTPEQVNQSSTTTDGHAHLMLNGQKIARIYGSWYHIDKLPSGTNELEVTLNTNKHEELTYEGKPIAAIAIVEVP